MSTEIPCDMDLFANIVDNSESMTNHYRIRALLLVQSDIVRDVLTDRQKAIVEMVVCKEINQNIVAGILGVSPSTVNRQLSVSIRKLRKYLSFCEKALIYYERIGQSS